MSDEESFLGRWSRRKRRPVAEIEPEEAAVPEPGPEEPEPSEEEPETDAEILARLDLADPDTLGKGDDFARYLNAPLPLHLKQKALRRLWVSNPVLANLDGLNDYDTDFTGGSVPMGALKTAYKVGRGFLTQTAEADRLETAEAAIPGESEDAAFGPEEAASEAEDAPPPEAPAPDDPQAPDEGDEIAEARPLRRMQFRFED